MPVTMKANPLLAGYTPWHEHEIFRLRPNERLREYECIGKNEDLQRFETLLEIDPALRAPK